MSPTLPPIPFQRLPRPATRLWPRSLRQNGPEGIAITPDGLRAYVGNVFSNSVSLIDTATNTLVTAAFPIPVGTKPGGVTVTPDGTHVYVVNQGSNTVSVIDTATNIVLNPVLVGNFPVMIGVVPPPPGYPSRSFKPKLSITFGTTPNTNSFDLQASFTLNSTASKTTPFDPVTEAVTIQVGTYTTVIPPGSFILQANKSYTFSGIIGGVSLDAPDYAGAHLAIYVHRLGQERKLDRDD